MELHELFLGAIVKIKNGPAFTINTIQNGYAQGRTVRNPESIYGASLEFLEPVQIRQEWLEMLGLEFVENASCWKVCNDLLLDLREERGTAILHVNHIHLVGSISYVHALQGIILHMTGRLLSAKILVSLDLNSCPNGSQL